MSVSCSSCAWAWAEGEIQDGKWMEGWKKRTVLSTEQKSVFGTRTQREIDEVLGGTCAPVPCPPQSTSVVHHVTSLYRLDGWMFMMRNECRTNTMLAAWFGWVWDLGPRLLCFEAWTRERRCPVLPHVFFLKLPDQNVHPTFRPDDEIAPYEWKSRINP